MKKSRNLQLKAMNTALLNHAVTMSEEVGLTPTEINSVKQNVRYGAPYNNMGTYKSNRLYKTMINTSKITKESIIKIRNDR